MAARGFAGEDAAWPGTLTPATPSRPAPPLPPARAPARAAVSEFARWNAALTAAASYYLCRDEALLDAVCSDLLTREEVAWLKACANPPVKVLNVMSQLVAR